VSLNARLAYKRAGRWREPGYYMFQKLDGGSAQYVACDATMFVGIAVRDAVFSRELIANGTLLSLI